MSIRIDIEGTFFSQEEAADAVAAVARDIRYGRYSAQARVTDNPLVSVTEVDDGEHVDADVVRESPSVNM